MVCARDGSTMSKLLFRSGMTVGVNTLVSRVLGMLRDIVIARVFGAGLGFDAFLVAFRLPNFLRRLFAEGAFAQAFIPVLAEYKEIRRFDEVQILVANVVGVLSLVLFLVSLLGTLGAPLLVMMFAYGFVGDSQKFELTVSMVRIMFPYIGFISLTSFAGSLLNTYGKFGVPAFTPVLLNVSLITSALWLAPQMDQPVVALAVGVFVAGIVQLSFQVPFVYRLGLLVRPKFGPGHAGVKRIAKLIVPATFGVSVSQINLMVDTLIASFLVTGSVTWLYLSDRLVEFPLGVFGIALATVILPGLSKQHAIGNTEQFSDTLDWALRLVATIGVPAAIALAVLAGPMLTTLFHYGAFSAHDVGMASTSLVAYSFGLIAFIAIKILAPGFFARQDTRTPVKIGIIAMLSNIVLNLALVVPLAHAGLALATSISAFINAGLLLVTLKNLGVYQPRAGWSKLGLQLVVANLCMVVVLYVMRGDLSLWLQADVWSRLTKLSIVIAGGTACYFTALFIVGVRPRTLLDR